MTIPKEEQLMNQMLINWLILPFIVFAIPLLSHSSLTMASGGPGKRHE
jgi:hypothetical protein